MAQAQFPEPKELDILELGDGKPLEFGKYTVSNPHPGFGKDPNILNEFGHTVYPKWVKTPDGADVIVQNADEEAEKTAPKEAAKPADGWGK